MKAFYWLLGDYRNIKIIKIDGNFKFFKLHIRCIKIPFLGGFGPLHVLTYQDKTLFRPSIAYWMLLGSFSTARLKKIESYEIKHMMEFFFWFRAQPLPDTSWQLYSGVLLTTTCLKDHLVPEGWKKSVVKEITYDGQNWLFFLVSGPATSL